MKCEQKSEVVRQVLRNRNEEEKKFAKSLRGTAIYRETML